MVSIWLIAVFGIALDEPVGVNVAVTVTTSVAPAVKPAGLMSLRIMQTTVPAVTLIVLPALYGDTSSVASKTLLQLLSK